MRAGAGTCSCGEAWPAWVGNAWPGNAWPGIAWPGNAWPENAGGRSAEAGAAPNADPRPGAR
ncbi:hypothetical protein DWQ67_01040 [Galactobacter caseinivorans]|uniref:Uncharacterized protein n=1 Tax=Galactobacter caseinivorans TaxID=2676123 RepID=A0A496PLR0_9MICC|nr:hypothetical protein DWQ67_01040 [Galactobacter caseinivorans]